MSCIECAIGWSLSKSKKQYGTIDVDSITHYFTYERHTCTKDDNSKGATCYSKATLNSTCSSDIIYGQAPLPGRTKNYGVGTCLP